MVWTGTFFSRSSELFQGVEGYFALNGVSGAGQIPTVNDVTTSTQVSFRAPNYLGRITFFGTDLAVGSAPLPSGQQLPVFTGGTITGIEFEYNYVLSRALEQGISDPSLYLPSLLVPSADLQLPNVPATALSNAVLQSYQARSDQPLVDFFSQDTANFSGNDEINLIGGFNGNDLLRGLGGRDILQGNDGDDTLDGGPGTDGLYGGEGNDLYLPGPPDPGTPTGDSVSDSGLTPGQIDTISYANAPEGMVIDLNPQDGNQSTGWAARLLAGGIEAVIGSNFDDTIVGTDFPETIQDTAADTLFGGLGDDQLYGLGGSDLLQGGPGFDTLIGGADGDIANAGPGDRAGFSAARSQIDLFRLADGSVLVAAPGGGVDFLREIEFLSLSDGVVPIANLPNSQRNLVIGTATGEGLSGSAGADLMYGRAGNDTLDGG
ncbi:calcium-binding protein, partial [Cribrihabitans sp. XS_ASV171]